MAHRARFHASESDATSGYVEMPTATHLTTDMHDTDDNEFVWPPGGLGDACTAHAVPSQRCASVFPKPWLSPTAVHADCELHDTPQSTS